MKIAKLLCIVSIIVTGCGTTVGGKGSKYTSTTVSDRIESELSPGSTSERIEKFFVNAGLAYSYDRFNMRYQSIIRDASTDSRVDHAIVIHIYVDSQQRYVRHEVRDSFTAPD